MLPSLVEQLRFALDWSFSGSFSLMLQYHHRFDMSQRSHSPYLIVPLFLVTCTAVPLPASITLTATPIHGLSLPKSPRSTSNSLSDAPAPLPVVAKPTPAPKNLSPLHQLLFFFSAAIMVTLSMPVLTTHLEAYNIFLWFFSTYIWEKKRYLFWKFNWAY